MRGEWAESVFMARAGEEGLAASKPWGDSRSYDCVVGRPGKFVGVQVKSTIVAGAWRGLQCCVCSSHEPYPKGSFDFLAAYVILEDAWYIIPEKEIRGLKSISLCTTGWGRRRSMRSTGKRGGFCGRLRRSASPRAESTRRQSPSLRGSRRRVLWVGWRRLGTISGGIWKGRTWLRARSVASAKELAHRI